MFGILTKKIFGSSNERYLKKLQPQIARINGLEPAMQALADRDFSVRIADWKQEVANGRPLDELLPEVFALVREAGRRVLTMRHFDVQLLGGTVLHFGKIAEMKTGEGKTLVATLPAVLNALSGKGVHLVTVNDYLAGRDADWMGRLYAFLGLSVGKIIHGLSDTERQQAYNADITYGTNNEFGFDYLRDNMKFYSEQLVQRPLHYAIVDEVDSILIDEARTPLIISGQADDSTDLYEQIDRIIPKLHRDKDFTLDEKARTAALTDEGVSRCEEILRVDNLFDPVNIALQHHVLQALKAHYVFHRDDDYIVSDGQVVIVDEFTGRLMPGRRYSDGLHQALEAKERVKVEAENQTLASITFQNYFRMYDKLSGMTGTADTEAVEFNQIYGLEVAVIPTHRPMLRDDRPDMIFKTQKEKFQAIGKEIERLYKIGQPVLVGTTSIEKSEFLSDMLKKRKIPHSVLNAKQHEQEAEIVSSAGQKGKVTIATNMAGRGTDIVLGEGVRELGGLHILGTERHESRRIDNQLRGRSGRQGDTGSSRFYLAMDDTLMRLFGSERMIGVMEKLGLQDGEAIENKIISRAIENAQRKVEGHNFDIRKQLLEYDDVMNQQRTVIYAQRREIMETENLDNFVRSMVDDILAEMLVPLSARGRGEHTEELEAMYGHLEETFCLSRVLGDKNISNENEAKEAVFSLLDRLKNDTPGQYESILRYFLLESLDRNWKDHLLQMDYLKEGIGLRGYGQRDPKQEYKREGFELFQDMLFRIKENTLRALCHLRVEVVDERDLQHKEQKNLQYEGADGDGERKTAPMKRETPKVGRNDLCPCGSGKKYKKCCGK